MRAPVANPPLTSGACAFSIRSVTLFLHEVHRVIGTEEDAFELAAQGWMAALAPGPDARLLGYWAQAHGTGPSYRVVTLTAIADWAAWERLVHSVQSGPLTPLVARLDGLRHDVVASLLQPLPWSPLSAVDFQRIVPAPDPAGPRLLMEDTMWPHRGRLAEYLAGAGEHYTALLDRPASLLRLDAALVTVIGEVPEVMLLQTVKDPVAIIRLFTSEIPPEKRPPGTWMHDALEWRDQWRSRLLRAAPWAPWPEAQ